MIAVLAVIVGMIAAPLLPSLLFRAVGLSPQGATDQVFQGQNIQRPSAPLDAAAVQTFTITGTGIGNHTVTSTALAYRLYMGTDAVGSPAARLEISEASLNQLCRERFALCQPGSGPVIVDRIDLRPGGAVIYTSTSADQFDGLTGSIGAVLQVDSTGRRLRLAGLDVNNQLYTLPDSLFGYRPLELEQLFNNALLAATVTAAGSDFRLDQISVIDETLIINLR
ncbi:MAG: hypothetical protein NZM00_09985 [Anaerolinea sp.]|nr:hypothetical protein [Anaerolinea sp.]